MLSKEVRDGLEAELSHLDLKKTRIEARISAIKAILIPLDEFGPEHVPQRNESVNATAKNGPLVGMGLREAMKTVLVSYPSGLRAAELSLKLDQMGFSATGKLPLKTRVWSEIGRLKKEKKVSKRGKRVVWLDKTEPTTTSEAPTNGAGKIGM